MKRQNEAFSIVASHLDKIDDMIIQEITDANHERAKELIQERKGLRKAHRQISLPETSKD